MKHRVAILAAIGWSALASAGGRKVLVLPIEGDADPAVRKQLTAVVVGLAKSEGGTVATGNTTFAETSAAIGCEAADPGCAEQVRAGLNVDELVYGNAANGNGQVIAVITRVDKGQTKRDQTVTIPKTQQADSAEASLKPLFGGEPPPPPPITETGSATSTEPVAAPAAQPAAPTNSEPHDEFFDSDDHKIGVGLTAGGGLLFAIGLALWSSESSLQDQINTAPTATTADITALKGLEDRASTKAWEGNVLVVAGLAAAGVGAYFLIRHHEVQATVAPVDHASGATVLVGGHW